jgi:hypothetical protein
MLANLGRLFRKSLDAFREGRGPHQPEDRIAELLSAMRREVVAARAALPEYEGDVARASLLLRREQDALEQCERRGAMAQNIGDLETARIANDFAERHREKVRILEQKVAACTAELELKRREADEMMLRYKEADANRFVLLSQLKVGETRARAESGFAGSPDTLDDDFARMAERMTDSSHYADALEELEEPGPPAGQRPSAAELDQKLQELKRRMGQQ